MSVQAHIATNRFGLGAKPKELTQAVNDPKSWLLAQLEVIPPVFFNNELPKSKDIASVLSDNRKAKKQLKKTPNDEALKIKLASEKKYPNQTLLALSADTINQAIKSDNSLNWRLLDFFSNHFSVSATGNVMRALAPTLEREAIAPNLLGNFEDMLMAVIKHPAMLIYLNNERSFGPSSRLGKKGRGLNENLAREIFELHTLGVNGGYTQSDIIELAKGITGWSVANPAKDKTSGFIFRKAGHEPGTRQLFGNNYANKGVSQGEKMLIDIARHPSTAKYVCYKLAHHFISDTPDPILLEKLNTRWQASNGNIKAVVTELINAQESWVPDSNKFKSPREFVISSLRVLNKNKLTDRQLVYTLRTLGQQPFNAGSPAGYGDKEEDWSGASAMMAKIEWTSMLAGRLKPNANKLLNNAFGENISDRTSKMVKRAESRQQAAILFLMSPEFLRR